MKRLILIATLLVSSAAFGSVVQPLGASPQVLIPAAGSTQGANGTFFRSDITIINLTSHDQSVALQWLPQAGPGATNATKFITLPAQTGTRSADFVSEIMQQSGLGSIIATGITSGGSIDTTARLYVNSRIWSPSPCASGTVSQSFPAIPVSLINTPTAALFGLGGADNPNNYRVNVGIVNVDPVNTQTFVISDPQHQPAAIQITVTIPPMSMQQVSLGFITPNEQVSIQNVTGSSRSNLWTAYSSTIDNTTGDAWSELAVVGSTSP